MNRKYPSLGQQPYKEKDKISSEELSNTNAKLPGEKFVILSRVLSTINVER
jgi:hypothetical protein